MERLSMNRDGKLQSNPALDSDSSSAPLRVRDTARQRER